MFTEKKKNVVDGGKREREKIEDRDTLNTYEYAAF